MDVFVSSNFPTSYRAIILVFVAQPALQNSKGYPPSGGDVNNQSYFICQNAKLHTIINWNEKNERWEEMQTLGAGCSKAEPKIFASPQTPSWGRRTAKFDQLELVTTFFSPTNPVWWGSMHAISSVVTDPQTHKHTHTHLPTLPQTGPITIHRAAASAQCKYGRLPEKLQSSSSWSPVVTSCARGDTICPRPSPPRGRPSAAEQTQRSSTFPRRIRSHADRCSALRVKAALSKALTLTLKVVSESRVTWAIYVPILVFLGLSVLDLVS